MLSKENDNQAFSEKEEDFFYDYFHEYFELVMKTKNLKALFCKRG